ncbi:MAG: PRC-barrel domain-containing protein [Ardenticatenaceae bacterium]|nr:PRC-barrel domain-containing protein [Anaerolineales bacterium]MCB8920178.1 PRC-barrel domain-containing protein [Ardenticatenaceae bacterium]
MDIPLDVDVFCSDGKCGRSTAVILNPVSQEITHVVVTTQEMLHGEYEVPVTLIEESGPDSIQLRCRRNTLAGLEPFHKVKFVSLHDLDEPGTPLTEIPETLLSSAWLWPYITANGGYGTYVNVEQIPHSELAVHRGAHVEAVDGHIGQVDEFIINPENNHITHLVLREGHLWGQKDITVPISEIERVESDVVYLKLDKMGVEALPTVSVKRRW